MNTYPAAVKWIHAQRIDGQEEWKIRFVDVREQCPSIDNGRMIDETPISEMRISEFAIFRNTPDTTEWTDRRPRRLMDLRDKTNAPICGLGNLINSFGSDWF